MSQDTTPAETPLERAIRAFSGAARMAEALGVTTQVVTNWRTRGVSAEKCPTIERMTAAKGERVDCEALRPDLRWLRAPDSAWPHPDGRPCIDVEAAITSPGALAVAGAGQ